MLAAEPLTVEETALLKYFRTDFNESLTQMNSYLKRKRTIHALTAEYDAVLADGALKTIFTTWMPYESYSLTTGAQKFYAE